MNNLIRKLLKIIRYRKWGILSLADAWKITFTEQQNVIMIKPRRGPGTISLRGGISSDREVFEQIYYRKDYNMPLDKDPDFIIDAGAHIGCSTMYLAQRFPSAAIAAIEPSPRNFELLKKNCERLPNIRLFERALYPNRQSLRLRNPECVREWGFQVETCSSETGTLRPITIPEIMGAMGFPHVDLLKLDIEGAELELFSQNYMEWINLVNAVVIEIHDFNRPGCSRALFSAVCQMSDSFHLSISGENLVIQRINPL